MAKFSLDRPVGDVVRTLVKAQMDAARVAFAALEKGKDPEALHDLRVALRRTRSLLRTYRDELCPSKRTRRELANLAEATNPARDVEVLLDLYSAVPLPRQTRERPGVAWVGTRLRREREEAASAARRALKAELKALSKRLRSEIKDCVCGRSEAWRGVLSAKVEVVWRGLDTELRALRGGFDAERAHHARIEAKRLRYLLEPVRVVSTPADALVKEARALQILLGDLHDTQVFEAWLLRTTEVAGAQRARRELLEIFGDEASAEADVLPGLVYLAKTVRAREAELVARVRTWLDEEGEARLAAASRALLRSL